MGPSDGSGGPAVEGWEAAGFHVGGSPTDIPSVYRGNRRNGFGSNPSKYFDASEQCIACHGESPPDRRPDVLIQEAHLDALSPNSGTCGSYVLLTGEHFGSEHNSDRTIQLKSKDEPGASWVHVPVRSWSNTTIEWVLPCWTFSPGNYDLRIYTELGVSNWLVFTVEDHPASIDAIPDSGPCSTWISLSGPGGFGDWRKKVFGDGYHGIHHVIDFVSPTGTYYTAKRYRNWSDTSLEVRFWSMFMDENDACTGQNNFIQDNASPVPCMVDGLSGSPPCDNDCVAFSCPEEPDINGCESMEIGTYSVYLRAIYFGDEDRSGGLSCGDTIFHVATSDALSFTLEPYIDQVTPKEIVRGDVLTVVGKNFGAQQMSGVVHIGSRTMAKTAELGQGKVLNEIEAWGDTEIRVNLSLPPKWENKSKYVWIEKDGLKSNFRTISILENLDPDGDGVLKDVDNCPDTPNGDQTDADADGLGDACDSCPGDPNNDVDGDGVCGNIDNCPETPNLDQSNTDGDGLGDACDSCPADPNNDADGDGVCGDIDNCPNTANLDQSDTDADGLGDACDSCPGDPNNDVDGDGVCGDTDNCPEMPNLDQSNTDGDGLGDACDSCPGDPNNDADGDSVCGDVDNCPDIYNAGQRDTDKDGVGNKCDTCPQDPADDADGDTLCADEDNCPDIANPDQSDVDADGTGDLCDTCPDDPGNDADGDGLCGDVDNCPETYNAGQRDTDKDGVGNKCDTCPDDPTNDVDEDGVCGGVDNCPDIANPDQSDVDADGTGDLCDACPDDPINDVDGDGVCGNVDNCPDTANPDQTNTDGDGQGNVCDACPNDPDNDIDGDNVCGDIDNCPVSVNPDQTDADDDGIGDICDICPNDPHNNADGDGVCGDLDNCPDTYNPDQEDADSDGQGDACDVCPYDPDNDVDGDGVCGDIDNCPATPNADQADSNGSGIGDACEPIADAGSDRTIISGDQAITVLQGAASDPNDDPCTFRWVEGETELSTWQAAGENGECYLDLNTVPSFSSGDHTLTLEVDDGTYTASDNMVMTVFPDPEIALIQASVTGGIGSNGIYFYVGDMVTFTIEYEITGGNPADQYEVAGVAVPQYPYCTNNQRRATAVDLVGPGVHTISFQKRVPGCADSSGWTVVKWRVDLRTEDGSILRDRDRLDTNDALVIYGS
jgi:hypothetical protein